MLITDKDLLVQVSSNDERLVHKSWVIGKEIIVVDYLGEVDTIQLLIYHDIDHYIMILENTEWIKDKMDKEQIKRRYQKNLLMKKAFNIILKRTDKQRE